jgi:hypothetical protein
MSGGLGTTALRCTPPELVECGLSGLMHVQLLLTQHFFAVEAGFLLRCGLRRGSGRSKLPISVDFKPTFRRTRQFPPTYCELWKR